MIGSLLRLSSSTYSREVMPPLTISPSIDKPPQAASLRPQAALTAVLFYAQLVVFGGLPRAVVGSIVKYDEPRRNRLETSSVPGVE